MYIHIPHSFTCQILLKICQNPRIMKWTIITSIYRFSSFKCQISLPHIQNQLYRPHSSLLNGNKVYPHPDLPLPTMDKKTLFYNKIKYKISNFQTFNWNFSPNCEISILLGPILALSHLSCILQFLIPITWLFLAKTSYRDAFPALNPSLCS